MTSTNHALSGALIVTFLPLPLAIPVALVSHFALDSLPHYGIPHKKRNDSVTYKLIVLGDILIGLSIAAILIFLHKWIMLLGGFVAISPDITWGFHYYKHGKDLHFVANNKFMRFHQKIQRFERPWGIAVELAVTAILMPIFVQQVIK